MSEQDWTPEPWFVVIDPPCELRRMVNGDNKEVPLTVDNLTRAAICINACAGVPTAWLTSLTDGEIKEFIEEHITKEPPND